VALDEAEWAINLKRGVVQSLNVAIGKRLKGEKEGPYRGGGV
jgi:hypothetical protein